MVFLSFFQVHMFYNYFDISIYAFITTFELLFYFIPYFIINNVKALLSLWGIPALVFFGFYFYDIIYNNRILSHRFFRSISRPLRYSWLIWLFFLSGLIYWCLVIDISLTRGEFCEWHKHVLHYYINGTGKICNIIFQLIFISWCLSAYVLFYPISRKSPSNSNVLYTLFMVLIFIFFFSSLKTTYRIYKVKYLTTDDYSFTYEGKEINTNQSFKVVGTTKEYIFVKDDTNKIHIYPMSKVDNLSLVRK
jgi:hypothetical protein